ncbi:DUF3857 domain-containing transglutaminase family protein [Vibrio sp. WXL103]|uniref:DUF3857 domain-containing transglutaminase family protein n=1 Tax=Vibrio sp. WXL103 TaxID=3450710 RepID=UPI003EC853E9
MKQRMMITGVFISLLLSLALPLHAKAVKNDAKAIENVEWQLDSIDPSIVIQSLDATDLPLEMTQLRRKIEIDIDEDTVTTRYQLINYFPRFVDAEKFGTQSLYYNPNYQRVKIFSASSISPAGQVNSVKKEAVQVLDTSDFNTFNSNKELVFPLPGLKEGSFSLLEYQVVSDLKRMETDWSQELFVQGVYPIDHYQLEVSWDESHPIEWAKDSGQVHCDETPNSLQCRGKGITAYKSDQREMWRDHIEMIALGQFNNWDQVVARASQAMENANRDRQGVDALLDRLTLGAESIEEKIERILSFVARDIRYVSFSQYGHAITPHTLAETIENRYGDCKDKSTLLKALLEGIGLDPTLVLVATYRSHSERMLIPSMAGFNHIVVCFELEGSHYCLDPTDTQVHWLYVATWIQGKVSLPLTQNAQPKAMPASLFRWRMKSEIDIEFTSEGGQHERQQRTYYGEYAASFRSLLYAKNTQEREEYLTEHYHDYVTSLGTPTFTLLHLDKMADEFAVHSENILPPFVELEQITRYTEVDTWLREELRALKLHNRTYPEYFPGALIESTFNFDTQGNWTINDLPATLSFKHKFGDFTRRVSRTSANKITVQSILRMPARTVPVEQREQFNQLLTTYAEQSSIQFFGQGAIQ